MGTQPDHCSSIFGSPSSLLKHCEPGPENMLQGQLKHSSSLHYEMGAIPFAYLHYLNGDCRQETVSQENREKDNHFQDSKKQTYDVANLRQILRISLLKA